MRILSIDSSLGTQLAVVDADPSAAGAPALRVLSQDEQADTRRHAESLGQMLSQAMSAPEVAERPLDAVVAATGPAPFTGLRAGLVTAGVVGRTRGVPVHGSPASTPSPAAPWTSSKPRKDRRIRSSWSPPTPADARSIRHSSAPTVPTTSPA